MVPKGWITKALELTGVKVIDGDRGKEYPKASDFSGDGYCLFLSAKNVTKYGFQFNELQFIDAEKDKKLRKGRVKRSNIVLTTRGSVGHFAYYDASVPYDVMRINSGMVILDADESDLEPNFLYALCRSFIVQKQIEAASFGSAQPQLTVGIVKGLKLPIPTLVEQKKIAQILSTWDKAISVTEKLLTNSQRQKKALMQQLLTGKKRLLDENGVRFSGEWVYLTFDNAFIVANKKSTQVKSSDYLQSGSIPIIDQGQSRIAGYCNNLEVYSDVPVIVFGDHTRCVKWIEFVFCPGADGTQVIKTSKILEPKLGYYLLSNTDIPNLGYSRHMRELKEKDFRLPLDIKEQQKIAAVLSAADAEISTLEKKLACLRDEKKALMQQLLTGKRRVKVDEAVAE
ncbi:restriction endonuclease subunit S [Escherichia coli]|uniref:restriction endonuclease subunit S n=1 Tax=Escherichia coli TaxID=562 RepID=UPI00157E1E31|nr:restriction endonuclease subunit S [Escherichia coli]NUC06492.1 restriction endonuclease subunit S [Escherichia coli]NUD39069.1 restriction endonuclease subunit S [Escherichia coli]